MLSWKDRWQKSGFLDRLPCNTYFAGMQIWELGMTAELNFLLRKYPTGAPLLQITQTGRNVCKDGAQFQCHAGSARRFHSQGKTFVCSVVSFCLSIVPGLILPAFRWPVFRHAVPRFGFGLRRRLQKLLRTFSCRDGGFYRGRSQGFKLVVQKPSC